MIDPKNLAATATLTFNDDFNSFQTWNGSSGWDTKWFYNSGEGGMGYNNELQWYVNEGYAATDAVNPWQASRGNLNIAASPTDAAIKSAVGGAAYTSGMINSYHDFSQTYGYFEMRAQLPEGQGLWPAFWLLREDGQMSSEIDIMEQLGNDPSRIFSTVHSFATGSVKSQQTDHSGTDTSSGYHTYGLNWTADKLEFYLDGAKYFEVATPADMHTPMYMIANLAVGGSWPGSPDGSTQFPAEMNIDYIRAYKDGAGAQPTTEPVATISEPTSRGDTLTAIVDNSGHAAITAPVSASNSTEAPASSSAAQPASHDATGEIISTPDALSAAATSVSTTASTGGENAEPASMITEAAVTQDLSAHVGSQVSNETGMASNIPASPASSGGAWLQTGSDHAAFAFPDAGASNPFVNDKLDFSALVNRSGDDSSFGHELLTSVSAPVVDAGAGAPNHCHASSAHDMVPVDHHWHCDHHPHSDLIWN